MNLSSTTVIPYLIERGIVSSKSAVDGDVTVVDTARRNRNFKVYRNESPSLFVKQVKIWNSEATTALRREAVCYWMAAKEPTFGSLAAATPRYEFYDPTLSVLVTGLVPGSENISEYHRRLGLFPEGIASALGRILRRYHELMPEVAKSTYAVMFSRLPPWILSVQSPAFQNFNAISGGNSQLISIMGQYPDFQRHFNALRGLWRIDSFIHGDMKWDNCVVEQSAEDPNLVGVRVVDWELSDLGDGAWDVAAIFQAYISFWVLSIPFSIETPINLSERANYPLESMYPAIRAFWCAYRNGSRADPDEGGFLDRCVRYAAARMIQTVYEHLYQSVQLTPGTLALLQVSLNMLNRPAEAREHLLGL
jgi:hypothetical protein